ncbi:MAG: aldehyde dehydrogenase [Flavobacteriaceae bacterium]
MENLSTKVVQELREEHRMFFKQHKMDSITIRLRKLKSLAKVIDYQEAKILEALQSDLKKPEFESYTSEFVMVRKEIQSFIKHLKSWSAPKRVSGSLLNFPSQDFILAEPYGTVLLISPWNYPFQLALIPLIGAIAAGNTVVLKPSESAPHTSSLLKELLAEVFPREWVTVVEGDASVAQTLLTFQWDYIFFTGSTHIGKIIAKSAAEHLTPITLELGGKSPCVVDGTTPIDKTAKRILFGKFLNCGQTCIAPDYVVVKKEVKDALIEAMIRELKKTFGPSAETSTDYGRIIHYKHFDKLVEDLKGEQVLYGGTFNRDQLYFEPTLVDEPDLSSRLMQDEIFGPILPIKSYSSEEELNQLLETLKNPLAFYVFSNRKRFIHSLMKRHAFGGAVINDSIVHFVNPNLPFGGIGNSGMGAYHGKHSFDLFTHAKPVVKRSFWFDLPQRYAPYPKKLTFFKWIVKKI